MPRGERVGEAYVRIHADGEGLNKEIRNLFDDAEPEYEKGGRRGSQAYSKAFANEMQKAPNQTALRQSLTDALAKGDFLSQSFFRSRNWTNFRSGLIKEFGDAGRLAGDNLENDMLQGMTFEGLQGRLDNIVRDIVAAQKQIQQEESRILADRERQHRDMLAAYAENENRAWREADFEFERHVQERQRQVDRITDLMEGYSEELDRIARGQSIGDRSRSDLIRDFREMARVLDAGGAPMSEMREQLRRMDNQLRATHPALTRSIALTDRFGVMVGRAFGKGSRNDFVNFIGSIAGGLARLLGIIPRVINGFLGLANSMRIAFDNAGRGVGGALAAITVALETGGVALLAFAGIVAGVVVFIGPLVSLLGSLLGIVVALAGSLSFALLGALGAVAGAMVPLAAGIGVVVAAFMSLNDAQKQALKVQIRPLVDAFRGLGEVAREGVFSNIGNQARVLAPIIRALEPAVDGVARAIARLGDYWVEALNSPAMAQFMATMDTFLPRAVEALGRAFGNTLGGLGGMFRAMTPFITDFLGWLERITGEFAEWANSVRGQEEIQRFFERAGESIQAVSEFLGEALALLSELFTQGRGTGDNIFERMAGGLRNLTEWLQDNPNAVSDWFGQAEEVAAAIGRIVGAVAKLVAELDGLMSRGAVVGILNGIAGALRGIANVVGLAADGFETMGRAVGRINWGAVQTGAALAFGGLPGRIAVAVQGIAPVLNRAFSRLPPLAQTAVRLIISPFFGLAGGIARAVGPAAGILQRTFNRMPVPARVAVTAIAIAFGGLPGRIAAGVAGVPGIIRGIMSRLPPPAQAAIRVIGAHFRTMPALIRGATASIPGIFRTTMNRLPPISQSTLARIIAIGFSPMPGRIGAAISAAPGIVRGIFNRMPPSAQATVTSIISRFRAVPGGVGGAVAGVVGIVAGHFAGIAGAARDAASNAVSAFAGLGGRILSAIGSIVIRPTISMPSIPRINLPFTASGGLFNGAQARIIGEAGPEAVVPLDRPLSQVDPAVRLLSAIAQGKSMPHMASGGVVGGGRQVTIEQFTVVTPNANPEGVAEQVINRLVAAGY